MGLFRPDLGSLQLFVGPGCCTQTLLSHLLPKSLTPKFCWNSKRTSWSDQVHPPQLTEGFERYKSRYEAHQLAKSIEFDCRWCHRPKSSQVQATDRCHRDLVELLSVLAHWRRESSLFPRRADQCCGQCYRVNLRPTVELRRVDWSMWPMRSRAEFEPPGSLTCQRRSPYS